MASPIANAPGQTTEHRVAKLTVRLLPDDRLAIRAAAAAADCTPSELVRLAVAAHLSGGASCSPIKRKPRRPAPPPVDPALLRQVAMIGNNLNQIARALNSAAKSDIDFDKVSLLAVLVAIEEQAAQIFPGIEKRGK